MSTTSAKTLSIVPLDSGFHSFIRFFIIPASIIADLYMMIRDYGDYNSTLLYTLEILCFALSIIMFSFTEVGFIQQARYSCYTVIVGCIAVTASNTIVMLMAWSRMPELFDKNMIELTVRIFISLVWAVIISTYYIKNIYGFYPSEKNVDIDGGDGPLAWELDGIPRERKRRESWVRNRLKSSVLEMDEEPENLE